MELSTHALTRMAQRGISKEMLKIIFKYGEIENAGNGCHKVLLGKRECNKVDFIVKNPADLTVCK